ncbi:flagellar hook-length control protein FliK [Photobacterium sp. DA100]|uniref:flagellar hook-length control protein FliK n=1 Tax=Photobacterium sp. DA100 TaxID=3027472 RepID=UPI002478D45D|nr:flagellar hook-length control protein FliK [Photobacterium sp. DA100]WEM41617.1 flagellar hook-length control protein FliK [Photobacterium sp. DA100]
MFLSQLLAADPSSATAKRPSATDSQSKEQAAQSSSATGFTETLQGAIGNDTGNGLSSRRTVSVAEGKENSGKNVAPDSAAVAGQSSEIALQDIENTELVQGEVAEELAGSGTTGKKEKPEVSGTAPDGDIAIIAASSAQVAQPQVAAPDSTKASMSEGEELLQRLSASHSQLAGASGVGHAQAADGKQVATGEEGKVLPPGVMATCSAVEADGKAKLSDEVSKAGVSVTQEAQAAKEMSAKDALANGEAKPAKSEPAGKAVLAGMTLSGSELAELKNNQGASPLSSGVTANGVLQSTANSQSAALEGSSPVMSAKSTQGLKAGAGVLAGASLDEALGAKGDDGAGTNPAELHGPHALRTATATLLTAEGEKPSAQPPMLLSKEQAGEQLADRVQMMMSKNLKHVDIRLDPPELGKLQIKLSMNNDQASVQITVANQQSRDLVEQAMPRLRELLQQQGLQLAQSTVQQDSSRSPQHNSQPGQQHPHGQQGNGQVAGHEMVPGNGTPGHAADLWMAAPKEGVDYYA